MERTRIDRRRLSQMELGKRQPSQEELVRLAELGVLQEFRREPRTNRCFRSRWVQPPRACDRQGERPLDARIAAAKKAFPGQIGALLSRLGDNEERGRKMDFLRNACLESGEELRFWLEFCAEGSKVHWLAPCRTGFRKLPILDPKTQEVVSDVRFPGLAFELEGLQILAFPQLTMTARGYTYRLDALLGVMTGGGRAWINVEVDGAGHVTQFDAERQERLGLLTIRITTDDLRSGEVRKRLAQRLRKVLGL